MDSNGRAAVKAYFTVFNEHVVSMNEKLDAYRNLAVELDKQWEERGKPGISDMEEFLHRRTAVKREVETLEWMCGEEVLYAAAHENAVVSLSPEQDEIFQRMPATDMYALLVENYSEKYRREKLAENGAVNAQYKNALEENVRLRREWGSANALAISGDDVAFAGEQAAIYRQYLGHENLVSADCRNEAHAIMPIHHPGITGKAIEAEREAHRTLSGDEAASAYEALQRRYVRDYTRHPIWDWRDARNDLVDAYNAFREQALSKPSFLRNLVSGGAAAGKWQDEGNKLLRKVRTCARKFEEMGEARHDACSGGYNEEAMENAGRNIRLAYPELFEKVEEVWEKSTSGRFEREAQQIASDREQSGSHALSR